MKWSLSLTLPILQMAIHKMKKKKSSKQWLIMVLDFCTSGSNVLNRFTNFYREKTGSASSRV